MPRGTATVDFDLHGIVGIRLLDATSDEAEAVRRQVGPIDAELAREPEITVHYVDDWPRRPLVRLLGNAALGFTDDSFFVLEGRDRRRTAVRVDFGELGGPMRIVCPRGTRGVPLLIGLVNLTALWRGALPLHASAFEYSGQRILVTGWAKGGKTETLLAFMEHGASYIGDEWIYLEPDTRVARGIPEPMRLWKWQLDSVPTFRSRIPSSAALRLEATAAAVAVGRGLLRAGSRSRSAPARLLRRALPVAERQLAVQVPPARLFGSASQPPVPAPIDIAVLAMSHADDSVTCEPIDGSEVAQRMAASIAFERLELVAHYLAYRFAFPAQRSAWFEAIEALESDYLHRVLDRVPALLLRHPYPMHVPDLFDALAPALPAASHTPRD